MTATSEHVLVVEDDRGLRRLLEQEFEEMGLGVESVACAEQALEHLATSTPSIIVSDLRLPGLSGIHLLERVKSLDTEWPPAFVVVTAFGSIAQAVEALKMGADDFLTKPLDLEHLRLRVQRLVELQQLRSELAARRSEAGQSSYHGILGRSRPMRALLATIRRVASGQGPVLITGESGVGKELVARALHCESDAAGGPFVPVNCAGIPEHLMESELFGHESGAFTGATRSRSGLFAEAAGGTLLLDEVGELPVTMQAKLLRVLQDGSVRKVGANREERLDVRVIVATNRDLERDVATKRFRADLFYRLATYIVEVPPLRARPGDVRLLATHFVERQSQGRELVVSPELIEALEAYSFPGNVRELESIVEHAVTFSKGTTLALSDLPTRVRDSLHGTERDRGTIPPALLADGEILTLQTLSERYIARVLELTGGNKRRAATLLGISRQKLYRHLARNDE
jgi:DNA-binding NtrC family response regulator